MPFYPRHYAPVFDGRTDVAGAYSTRSLRRAFTGPLIQIRRSSDSATQDFYANGARIDYGAVSAFIGGGSGAVAKWYDQSGNGRNLVQASAALQPAFALLSNGLLGMTFNGVAAQYLQTGAFTLAQPASFNIVYRRTAAIQTNFEYVFDGIGSATMVLVHNLTGPGSPTDNALYAGAWGPQSDNGVSMATGTRGAVGGAFNGASSLLEVNATTVVSATGNAGAGTPGGLTLGISGALSGSASSSIEVQEWVVFNTAHASAQVKADNAAMRAAWRF